MCVCVCACVSVCGQAERYYVKAGMAVEAVDMYSRAGRWEAAQKVARGYLSDGEMRNFYR